MNAEILSVLIILLVATIFLVFEWIPAEITALLVLVSLALSGVIPPFEAISGFGSPAVVTIWAVFILSGGLTRTGVGDRISRLVLKFSGRRERVVVLIVMLSAGVMSAFMNNTAVAALMLPVVADIARRTGISPFRLFLPLSYGSLLGGLTTLIGTSPNILVSEALANQGLKPFGFFDFTPIGLCVMLVGIVFMTLAGPYLIPDRKPPASQASEICLETQYGLQDRMFLLGVPEDSRLSGKTLAEIRMGALLGLNVVTIYRKDHVVYIPGPHTRIQAADRLLVTGRIEQLEKLRNWLKLTIEPAGITFAEIMTEPIQAARVAISEQSDFKDQSLYQAGLRKRFGIQVLAILESGHPRQGHFQDGPLKENDVLLVFGPEDRMKEFLSQPGLAGVQRLSSLELSQTFELDRRLFSLRVPPGSALAGKSLRSAQFSRALGMQPVALIRKDGIVPMPDPDETILEGDRLVILGRIENILLLKDLETLSVQTEMPDISTLESGEIGMVEAIVSPHGRLAGKTLRQLNFREKYGLNVLAIWREGRAHRSELSDTVLRVGEALLLLGPRKKLQILAAEKDFIILSHALQEEPRREKIHISVGIMILVLIPVLLGWIPIYVSAVLGASLMVISGCLTMEEAHRFIEWKAVFLIAGMLPLGTAMDQTGAARFLAENLLSVLEQFGPMAVMAGLIGITFLAVSFIPPTALVVLMVPIVLSTAADTGISAQALTMAVAMAAASSFMTPITHPANLMVMGPGGYRFLDYLKAGLPLTLVVMAVLMVLLPVFWPLFP